jgi:polyribonucleotide nucleotidyltransferase
MENVLIEPRETKNGEFTVREAEGKTTVEGEIAGRTLKMETGEMAKQAGGSVMVQYGETVVLCMATMSAKPREGIDFFPLSVDFEEKMYAAGKIPGGFFKREGRPSEKSIISARQIDRPLRPLFPDGMRHEVQIICLVLSADQENDPDVLGMVGASAALALSGIPFNGPIAGVRIGMVDDDLVVNPTLQQLVDSRLDIVVSGTKDSIMMVEAGAKEVSNGDMLAAIEMGHQEIKKIIEMIEILREKAGKPAREVPLNRPDPALEDFVLKHFTAPLAKAMRIIEKQEREAAFAMVNTQAVVEMLSKSDIPDRDRLLEILSDEKKSNLDKVFKAIEEEELRKMVVEENLRPDGRKSDEIRPLSAKVGFLPRTHGSGMFTRGQTQVLTNVTLAPMSEGQTIDGLGIEEVKRYMHQYNFPPFSVGETRPMRGPGRREIGHGNLAERAVSPMIPDEDEFPYAIRLVSEVLESNGSSSMASVCASTLAIMDAGIPLIKPVAGIAMGLIFKDGKYKVLTDIQGLEDALGEMDFKVAGTRDGITALQMDIKVSGISIEIMRTALEQAEKARMQILAKILETIPEPRAELSPYAPRIFTMIIDPDKIREVIGPGGKVIHKIIDETGCKIDIENDGTVYIASNNLEMAEKAQQMIEMIISEPQVGEVYLGKVVRITDFGAFVELKPGKDGMIHISDLSTGRLNKVQDVLKINDEIAVEVAEIDSMGRINLKDPEVERQRKALGIEKPSRPERSGGRDRRSGPPRGGGGGGRGRY